MKKDYSIWKSEKGNEKKQDVNTKQDKGKDKASSSVKIEEINVVSEESQDGDVLLT